MSQGPALNAIAAEDWAGAMGERWLTHLERFEGMIAPVGAALLQHAAFQRGERVIDVGCGAGPSTLEIARAVGPAGRVLGLDICAALVNAARARAVVAGLAQVEFACDDAARFRTGDRPYDRLFSRFGLMFFADAAAAFRNLHRLLRRGGRADFSTWAPAAGNLWLSEMVAILGQAVALPPPVPRAPGPFALDDPGYIRELLEQAGFDGIRIELWRGEQLVGGPGASAAQAADFVLRALDFGRLLEGLPPPIVERIVRELTALFRRYAVAEGIRMPAEAYLVTATA